MLIDAGANVHECATNGEQTPLHLAAIHCINSDCIETLINAGANVNVAAGNKSTSLHYAIRLSDGDEYIHALLAAGADANVAAGDAKTPLHYAAELDDGGMSVCALLAAGADLNATAGSGNTPLHYDNNEHVRALLAAGADVNTAAYNKETPLHCAARYNDGSMSVRALLAAGADVNVVSNDERTPLHYTARHYDSECIHTLLDAGADVNETDKSGRSPLHDAVKQIDEHKVRLLLDNGVNVHATDRHSDKPLHMLRAFLKAYDAKRENETSEEEPSRLALFALEIVKALLVTGAGVSAVNKKGETPLFALLRSTFLTHEYYRFMNRRYYGYQRVDTQLLWKELVKRDARTDTVVSVDNYGPLTCAHLAVKFADVDLLSTYVAHDGDIDVRSMRLGMLLQLAYALTTLIDENCAKFFFKRCWIMAPM